MLAQVGTTVPNIADVAQGDSSAASVLWALMVVVIVVGAVAVWRSRRGE